MAKRRHDRTTRQATQLVPGDVRRREARPAAPDQSTHEVGREPTQPATKQRGPGHAVAGGDGRKVAAGAATGLEGAAVDVRSGRRAEDRSGGANAQSTSKPLHSDGRRHPTNRSPPATAGSSCDHRGEGPHCHRATARLASPFEDRDGVRVPPQSRPAISREWDLGSYASAYGQAYDDPRCSPGCRRVGLPGTCSRDTTARVRVVRGRHALALATNVGVGTGRASCCKRAPPACWGMRGAPTSVRHCFAHGPPRSAAGGRERRVASGTY
jgi:hypothetical protein